MAPSPEELADGGGASTTTMNPPPPSHRELDDEYLLNQTRIWLEKVLDKEFDKDVNLSDLLADGQILFDVYKEFRRMLISVNHPSQHKFLEKESVSSTKIAEIYPYVKVELFLQVCEVLGVRDAELFPTSDVVHKNNTLQVCTCLRSLSKNAISWKLDIPEFDSVAVTHRNKSFANLPTDMVGTSSITSGKSDEVEIAETSSPSEVLGSGVGDSYQLVDHELNHDQENNPIQSPILVNMSVESDETTSRNPGQSEGGEFGSVQSDEVEIAETSSSSEVIGSAVGDSCQLVDHQSNHDHINNSPRQCATLPDTQASDKSAESDGSTADNETESNVDECKPPWKLLKLIAGGTGAVVAVSFMIYFLSPRKKGTQEKKLTLPNPTKIAATEKREEQERGCCINKFYPAYKLKF